MEIRRSTWYRVVLVAGLLVTAARPAAAQRAVGWLTLAEPRPAPADTGSTDPSTTITDSSSQDLPFTMRLGARVQLRSTHASGEDVPTTNTVHIRRARMSLTGEAYERFDYVLQMELAGSSAQLIDANVRHTFAPFATLWVGQGKAYFGRQQLNSSGNLQFVDRTAVDARFSAGRQQGIGLVGRLGGSLLEYNLGAYNGHGINQSLNPNNRFMTVGRVVLSPLGPYGPSEAAHDYPARPRLAVGASGLRNTLDQGAARVAVRRVNAEAAFMLQGFSSTAEVYREWADPALGASVTTDGWYQQAGYLLPGRRHELAARYATIRPATPEASGVTETGVAYSYYLRAHSAKIQADVRKLRDRADHTGRREARVQFQLTL